MVKEVIYRCDVCSSTQDKPFKLHLIANYGSNSDYVDVCCEECAVKFAHDAATKAGI